MWCTWRLITSWLQRFCASVAAGRLRDQRGLADRRERIAQLVRERREELVLAPVGFAQRRLGALAARDLALRRLVQPRVVDGDRGLRREADERAAPCAP